MNDWKLDSPRLAEAARSLADLVTAEAPQWHGAVSETPRHRLVPNWWEPDPTSPHEEWDLADVGDPPYIAAYEDRTLVTRVGVLHADLAQPSQRPKGLPTSSSTLPSLVVRMLDLLATRPGDQILDIGTGTGYATALVSHRFGSEHVTSIDVDSYLTDIARTRLADLGHHPSLETVDATGPVPGEHDRMMATVSARPIPQSWLKSLAPGGRLVTTIAGTSLLVIADKRSDGTATGHIDPRPANFMRTRRDPDYPPRRHEIYAAAKEGDGEEVRAFEPPIPDFWKDWQLTNLYELEAPGFEFRTAAFDDGSTMLWLLGRDGSWARAESATGNVHQSGARRLWDDLERVRHRWNESGNFPLHQLQVELTPDRGVLTAPDGRWTFLL